MARIGVFLASAFFHEVSALWDVLPHPWAGLCPWQGWLVPLPDIFSPSHLSTW